MDPQTIRLLLVDDDEDAHLLTRRMLSRIRGRPVSLEWAPTYEDGLAAMISRRHDLHLVDYRLGPRTGIELLQAALAGGSAAPVIIVAGQGDERVEQEALRLGAADYLVKGSFDAARLEHAIVHAIERHRAQEALAEERGRLRTLMDNLPDCVYFKDGDGRFLVGNAAQIRLVGASRQEELAGRTDADFFPASLVAQYRADEARILETGEPLINREELVVDHGGRAHWMLTSKVPLLGAEGRAVGIVGLSRDITELKAAQEELRRARDELEQRVRERTGELSRAVTGLRAEISERQRAEDRLREAEGRYRLMFEQANDGIVVLDAADGRIVEFNAKCHQTLGYTREEFARLRLADFEVVEDAADVARHIRKVLRDGGDVFETRHRTRQGRVLNMLVSTRTITIAGHQYIHAVWRDITERRSMEDDLRRAIARLEQHDRAKSEFVSNVSHELKTPLTSMLYGIRNLLKGVAGPLSEQALQYLRMFDGECQRLVNTVNDILDLGKVDNRSLVLTPVSIPMVRLVARHVESIRVQAETKRLALALAADAEAGFVACDPEKMGRVVQNILANAIKFTPSGGTVEVTVGRDLPDGRRVTMTVTDTGIGIPAEALGHITERYFRAGNPPTGSGLGLALSQEIVTLHGGSLEVCSPPPGRVQGTQVTVRLPAVKAPMLLVVDDDPAACRALEAQLGRYGYRVVTCETAQEGLRRVEELEPNALILDLILPDLPGVEVLQRLKASSRARFLPVVALTGANVDEARAEVLQRFAIPVVAKPWHEAEMLDQIEGALIGMAVFHPRRQDAKGAEDEGVAQTQRADH